VGVGNITGVGVVEAMADLNPSVLVKGVGVNLMGLERSSWTLLNLTKLLSFRALGSLCSAEVISITFESSAIIVSNEVDARGAKVVRKCDGKGLLVVGVGGRG